MSFHLTLAKVRELIRQGNFKEADEILRPHCRFPTLQYRDAIIDLELRIVDGLAGTMDTDRAKAHRGY